ncbi:MAG: CPBP family intramembrane metalloprotease [Verrucomicrobia bacterium]|nr:CPBP family intramembrane metalloprotease [Verrucomicrobiota bacterium]MDA1066808.1 CPBP family intramembrane metalloprotease [Verrucomicrobiota bacterium]
MSGFSRDSFHVLFNGDEYQFSLKGLKVLVVAMLLLHLIAALLAPAAYKTILWWNVHFPNSLNESLIAKPFPVYFDRARWFVLLLSIPWMFIQCRLLSFRKIGYSGNYPWISYFLRFYMLGLIGAVCVFGILIAAGVVEVASSLSFGALLWGMVMAFVAALILASFEELVFRGLLFRMFYTAFTPIISVVFSSLFFAYLHFKDPIGLWDYDMPPADVSWFDGLTTGFWVLAGIVVNFDLVLFLNLSLVGFILTVVFLKSRSLWAAVGLHAGWVTPILLFTRIAAPDAGTHSLWWGSFRLTDGYFVTVCLLILAIYFSLIYNPRTPSGYS